MAKVAFVEVDPERGARIRAFRDATRRTQEEVAGLVGISPRVYNGWESQGRPIRRRNLVQLAAVLHVDVREIDPDAPPVAAVDMPAMMIDGDREEILERFEDVLAALKELSARAGKLDRRLGDQEDKLDDVVVALQGLAGAVTGQRHEESPPAREADKPRKKKDSNGGSPSA